MARKLDKYREFSWTLSKSPVHEDLRYLSVRILGQRNDEPSWNLSPDYQRGSVWTQRQKELFVGNFIEGGLCPPIYIQRFESEKNYPEGGKEGWLDRPNEVIDGKQRLQALLDWVDGKIEAEVTCGDRIHYSDLDIVDLRGLPNVRVTYIDLSYKDRLRFYLKLNRGGTVHSDEEISKVRDLLKKEEGK